jgi:hypothetical protein
MVKSELFENEGAFITCFVLTAETIFITITLTQIVTMITIIITT